MDKFPLFIKKQLALFLLVSTVCFTAPAQNVARVEYFVDADPGFGAATSVSIAQGQQNITANFQFNINGLTPGFHNLYVRSLVTPYQVVEDGRIIKKGGWSLTPVRTFYKENITAANSTLPNITAGEYFIDTDPGFGSGKPIALSAGTNLTGVSFTFDITLLTTGFHNLFVRFRDANGKWSVCSVRNFYKESIIGNSNALPNITKGEYFIDTDPGFGSGTNIPIAVPGSNLTNVNFTFDITALPAGFHNLYVRFRDANGRWSMSNVRNFYKENSGNTGNALPNIVAGEYFIDNDPGFGAGKTINTGSGVNLSNINFTADITSLQVGFHHISTRYRDANGKWSQTNTRIFYKEQLNASGPLSNIVSLEYFVDTDPGFGSGKKITVNPAADISNLSFSIDMSNVSIGNHIVYVRALNANGKWSLVSNGSFKVEPAAAIYITVGTLPASTCSGAAITIPFSVNTPYGSNNIFTAQLSDANGSFASPVNIGSFAGNNSNSINATLPANTAAGIGYRVRIISSSPLDTSAAASTPLIVQRVPEQAFSITGASPSCIGSQVYNLSVVSPNTTYTWALSGGGTLTANSSSATVNWTTAGTHSISVIPSNTCGNGTKQTLQVTISSGTPTITASGPLNFCEGGSVTLTSSADAGNTWSNGSTAKSIVVTSSGTYNVTTGGSACNATSADVVVTVTPNTITTFNTIAPFCSGSTAPLLPATSINGIAGTWNPAVVNNSSSGTYIFTASSGTCITASPMNVVVLPVAVPVFSAITAITPGSSVPVLPTTSQNGISGTWNPATISNTQTGSYTFTPAPGQCASPLTITVVVKTAPDLAVQNVASSLSSIAPNEAVTVSWKVANVGSAASATDWTEKIYIQAVNGSSRTLLKQSVFTSPGSINVNQNISRSDVVTIPAALAVGDQAKFAVEIIPGTSVTEAAGTQANNTGVQSTTLTILKLLSLELTAIQLQEGDGSGITVRVNRTGSLTNPLTVNIATLQPLRYTVPASIVIPAGQSVISFALIANENTKTEGTIKDTISVAASGFQPDKAGFQVLDNDNPTLSITALPASANEGNTVLFKISSSAASAAPAEVFINSSNQARFPVPASVIIPAGALSVNVSVNLVQDNIPELSANVTINAAAANQNAATASIEILDDDLPGLELVLQTNTVSESAGYFATEATLRRKAGSSTIAFTANLSASTINTLILPASITLAANENEKTFTIGVLDNTLVDGDKLIDINAAIFVNSCGCSAPPSSSGAVSAAITVSDDDGPALQLTTTLLTLPEGTANAGLLKISRNTSTAQALTVALTSSNTGEATLPAAATIAAGQSFTEIPITTINDNVTDGSQQVNFKATAAGFSAGTVWVLVTDLNKPDLQIPTATVSGNTLQAMTLFNYQLSVKNTGFATAGTGVVVKGYLSDDDVIDDGDTLVTTDVLTASIPVGQSVQVVNAAAVPNLPGQHKLIFKVNPSASVAELLLTNNTSLPVAVTINPDYTATAIVSADYFIRGTAVAITGKATKSDATAAANSPVEVYVITQGFRRTIAANTDAAGNYTASFVPLANEAGHYIVGAGYPGTNGTAEQDAFDILGVKINNGQIPQFKIIISDTLKGALMVQNLSGKDLTGFTLAKINLPNGAFMRFDTIGTLAGNSTATIGYAVTGSALSAGTVFLVANLQAVSKQGNIQPLDAFYYCQAPNGYLEANVNTIDVAISPAAGEKLIEIKLTNKGIGATGDIKINLPQLNWLSSVTPVNFSSLAPGDSVQVILKFSALSEVPFDFGINGSIGVSTQNGNSFTIPFTFKKVSQTTGSIKIVATDQFTYYTDAAPKVAGAHVVVKNYYTNQIYAEGNTDANGIFEAAGLPEGTHKIMVEKEKHLPYSNTITINPGNTVEQIAFLNYQAITFSWTVVPTAIQDEYDITLTTQFETNVPVPVVTIDMPKTMPQLSGNEQYAFNAILTNHGLITAKDVTLSLPTGDAEYEFITNYVPADLMAQQSVEVPVIMRKRSGGGTVGGKPSYGAISEFLGMRPPANSTLSGGSSNCQDFAGVVYWYKCNLSSGLWQKGGTLFNYSGRVCSSGPGGGGFPPISFGDGSGGGGGVYYPICAACPCIGCGQGGGTTPTPPAATEKKSCVECLSELAQAVLGCFGVDVPPDVSCFIKTLIENGGPKSYTICLIEETVKGAIQGAVVKKIGKKIPYLQQLLCLKALLDALETCLATATERPGVGKYANKGELSNNSVLKQVNANLLIVRKAYTARVNWNTEYFGDLSNSGGWNDFSVLITPYVENLTAITPATQDSIVAAMAGYEIAAADIRAFFTRWNKSIEARNLDILSPNPAYPDIINWTLIKSYSDSLTDGHNYAVNKGYNSVSDMKTESEKDMNEILDGQKNAVCASVTVELSQKLTMTREAFEGTLEIFNGHPTDKMDSLTVNVQITDENGVPSNGLFEIQIKSLANLSDVSGTGNIAAQQKGSVKFLFIPEIGAAPTAPKLYNFGGTVRYFDPYAKAIVTLPLAAVQLTVNPSPNLFLHYFLERNVLGDDALTSPEIEPSIPAELAVMVENSGYGPAVNMTISSAQPKIVDNEKGLAINFKLIGSNYQGQPKNLGVTNINFGTVPPLQARIGQWYFTSSLLGKFVSYEAKVVHNNSFGNPDLSLVKGIKLHELTRSIKEYGNLDDGINDFLVNDYFDVHDVPDILYFSQGSRTAKVTEAGSGNFSAPVAPPSFTNTLSVTASTIGWNYIKLNDPGNNNYELVSVTRNDGQLIPLNNAWLTFVTLPVSQPPVYENKFHFVDTFSSLVPVTYTVVWKPKNTDVPKVIDITGVPAGVTSAQVQQLTVVFNKHIDPASFTFEDLALTFQGGPNISTSVIKITATDTATFNIDLSAVTTGNGFYNLTVQAAEIKDIYGINGLTGRQATWTQFLTVPSVQAFLAIPENKIAAAYDTINVLFNLPIDVSTVTSARFIVLKNNVVVPGTVTIDSVRADHKLFYLSGLGSMLTQNGVYEFMVDLPNIKSESQEPGLQPQSIKLTVDNTGPSVISITTSNSNGLNAQHVTFVDIQFDEDVFGFNTASIQLTRDGAMLPLNIAQLSNSDLKTWMAGNFGLLTYAAGEYIFTINKNGFTDAAGNKGSGTAQIKWTVSNAPLVKISGLKVTPDLGFSVSDGITSVQSLGVSFDIDAAASKVMIAQTDLSGETILATLQNVAAGKISQLFTLNTAGNTGIKIVAIDENGGSDTATQLLYIDQLPLTAKWSFIAPPPFSRQPDTVILSFSHRPLNDAALLSAIQLKLDGNVLPLAKLKTEKINDTAYYISGIRKTSGEAGNYEITAGLSAFSKYSSGLQGAGATSAQWKLTFINNAPTASAGNDLVITASGTYKLDGSESSDADGDAITYKWVEPDGIVLNDASSPTPSFTINAGNQGNTYSLLLIVSDGKLFSTDAVNIKVALPAADISFTGLASSYCITDETVTLTGSPAGGVFTGDGINGNTFSPATAGAGDHVITYTKDDKNYSQTTKVIALITPTFTTPEPLCESAAAPVLPLISLNGITGTWNPSVVSNTATGAYLFTPAAGQCAAEATLQISVHPLPVVSLAAFNDVCKNYAAFALTGGLPAGGTYSGTGVSNGQFDAAQANAGSNTITYTVVNANGCTASAQQNITVIDCGGCTATVTANGATAFCSGGSVTLTASAGASYLWSNGATTQSITVSSGGSYRVNIKNNADCAATSAATVVTVNDLPATPTITAGGSTVICTGQTVTLTSSAGAAYLWSNGAATQNITVSSSGNFSVVVKNDAGCSSPSSDITNVAVTNCTNIYCEAGANKKNRGYINRFYFRDIANSSGWNNGYGDYTSRVAKRLDRCSRYTMAIVPGYTCYPFKLYVRVWIDYNQDGDFDDEGEMVWSPPPGNRSFIGRFIVSGAAKPGTTRMRVIAREGAYPSACGRFNYGDVEDYTVVINNNNCHNSYAVKALPGAGAAKNNSPVFQIFPNPVADDLVIMRMDDGGEKAARENTSMRLVDVNGRLVMQQMIRNETAVVNVSSLINGIYFVQLQTGNSIVTKKIIIHH